MIKEQTSADYFKTLNILFTVLLAGQLSFAVIVYFLVSSGSFTSSATELQPIFMYLVPALLAAGIAGGNLFFKKKLKDIAAEDKLSAKLNTYRAALIVRFALIEGPCLFAIIAYLISGCTSCIAMAAAAILVFFSLRPTKEKLFKDLDLSTAEMEVLDDPAVVVTEFEVKG